MKTQVVNPPTLALTAGEPAGIGPDLCVTLAQREIAARVVAIADCELLRERAKALALPLELIDFTPESVSPKPEALLVRHVPLARKARAGELDPVNSAYVLRTLEIAAIGCMNGEFDAMVTGPVHKGVINDAGIPFTGHTEYLAQITRGEPVMMLVGGGLRVALATIHVALKEVPRALTRECLTSVLRILDRDLKAKFGIVKPRILVAGLNPHAGEGGHIGREEIEVISPVLDALRAEGMHLTGPLPADTIFNSERLRSADCVLAIYHDQGLPVLKFASFGEGVNITLGLPIIRTSVDHGTALELAGTGRASDGSLLAAIDAAVEMAQAVRQRSTRQFAKANARSRPGVIEPPMTNHRPIKRFGQHFLADRRVLERLVEAIAPASDDNMVEIGPGQGALTRLLLERVEHVHAVEIDRNLARALGESESPRRLTVHCADALRFDFAFLGEKLRVVGNLPYYISTEILFRLAEIATIKDVHVMLQKEVVDRITASPSSKNYGRLSVTLQRRFCARPLFDVAASAFRPMPKVTSALVALVPRPHTPSVDERTFNAIVSAAFSQRRKKLANSLRQYLSESELQSLAIDPALRAENLTGDDFVRVARFVGERA